MATRCLLASGFIVWAIGGFFEPPVRAANQSGISPESAVYSDLVPSDAFFAMHFHPRRVLATRSLAKLGIESLFGDMAEHTGFSPLDLDEFAVLIGPSIASPSAAANPQRRHGNEPRAAMIGRLSKPRNPSEMAAKWLERRKVEEFELAGHKCFRAAKQPNSFGPRDEPNFCFLDGRTFVIASEKWLPDVLAAKGAMSPLISSLAASSRGADATIVFAGTGAAYEMIAEEFLPNPAAGGPMQPIGDLVELLQTARLSVFTDPDISLKLTIVGKDDDSAAKIAKAIKSLQQIGQASLPQLKAAPSDHLPADQRDARELAISLLAKLVDGLVPHQTGEQVTVDISGICTVDTLVGKVIIPATAGQRRAAQQFQKMNNLRQLGLAMLSYESEYNHFPTNAIYSKEGKPLLSWRVSLLPNLDQAELYKQFHLDEPWDSANNKPLIAKMPAVFFSGNKLQLVQGKTPYVVPFGKGTIFEGDKGITAGKITDGLSNTILLLQVGDDKAVTWTKPDDMDFDSQKPLAGLGTIGDDGIPAVFADCHTQSLRKNIDAETFRRLILRNDGLSIDQSKL